MTLSIHLCLDKLSRKQLALGFNILVENRSTIGMLRDSIDRAFKQRSDLGYTKDPSGITCRISLTISSWKKWITLLARCARHDITLPGHIKANVITLGNVPTIISDRDSDPIGVMIPQTQDVREGKVQHK